ncbi:MAG: LrgB family protein [Gammaproteobacteria bacterium]|nr:LrgB family protein [Gammaproteobacteria bacterium]
MMLYLALPLTILLYWLTRKLYQRIPLPFINPLLIPMVVLMLILHFGQLPLQDFMDGTWIINWLLKPAVVALALPLYQQMIHIKAKIKPIMICCSISVVISILTSMLICQAMGIDEEITRSIATRSITTPLAMSVSESLGGIPSIAAAVVIMVGISGAVIGFPLLKLFGVTDPQAQGLAIGACSHAIGTAAATERGVTQGAFSSLALVVCGILTALIAPIMFAIYGLILGIN